MSTKLHISLFKTLTGHTQSVYSICEDGKGGFYSAGADGFIVHWKDINSDNGELFAQLGESIFSVFWDNENEQIIAGTKSGDLYILKKGSDPIIKKSHSKGVFVIKKYGKNFLSGGGDGRLVIWDDFINPKAQLQVFNKSIRDVFEVDQMLQVFGSTGECALVNTNKVEKVFKIAENSIFSIYIDQNYIITAGREALIRIYNRDYELLESIKAHWFTIHSLAVSPGSKLLASGGMDKRIRIWDFENFIPLGSVDPNKDADAHKSSVNKIIWLDSKTLISCSDDAHIKCWKVSKF